MSFRLDTFSSHKKSLLTSYSDHITRGAGPVQDGLYGISRATISYIDHPAILQNDLFNDAIRKTTYLISMMFSCLRLSRILISLRVLWIVKIISIIITITIKMHIMIVWTFSFKFKIWHLSSNRFWHQISRSQWLK